jgi:hypothetical protein
MYAAAVVLALAALGGLTIAVMRLRGTPRPPIWIAIGHGTIAATGLGILAYAVATQTVPMLAQVSLGVLLLAAFGGGVLFFGFHLKGKDLPISFVLGHGLLAIAGYALLVLTVYRGH